MQQKKTHLIQTKKIDKAKRKIHEVKLNVRPCKKENWRRLDGSAAIQSEFTVGISQHKSESEEIRSAEAFEA